MKTNNLKIPFIASLIFHSMVLFTIASHFSSVKDTVMNITPIEILNIEDKNITEQKIEDTSPPLSEKEIQKIKEEIQPQVESVKPETNNIVEAPPLIQEVKEELPLAKAEDTKEITKEIKTDEIAAAAPNEMLLKSDNDTALLKPSAFAEQSSNPVSSQPVVSRFASLSVNSANPYGVAGGTGSGSGEEMSMFRAMVRTKIERAKFYPRWAREKGFEGVVGVRFVVHPDGGVSDVTIVRPCHCEVLNKAACEAIMKAAPFNPRPVDVADREMAMEVDISYRLD